MRNKIKNIKAEERTFWRTRKKTTGSVIINTYLNTSSRPEGILHHLCKFYIACWGCKGCYNLKDVLKVIREDLCFSSARYSYPQFDI